MRGAKPLQVSHVAVVLYHREYARLNIEELRQLSEVVRFSAT